MSVVREREGESRGKERKTEKKERKTEKTEKTERERERERECLQIQRLSWSHSSLLRP
jgi:hypothetical protein